MQALAFFLQQQPTANPATGTLFMLVAMGGIFYFLVFMPMQRQKKQQAQMLASLEAGSEILTTGGIVGTIVNIYRRYAGGAREAGQHQAADRPQRRGQPGQEREHGNRKEVN